MSQRGEAPNNVYPADYLQRVLSALQSHPRLRELLGDAPLSKLSLRVLDDGLVVEAAEDAQVDRAGAQVINDCVREALTGEHSGSRTQPILAPRMSTSAGPGPHAIAARSHLNAGNPGRAAEILEAALARWPDSVELHTYHAVALSALGRDEEAVAAYAWVLQHDPRSVFARSGIARVLAKLGRWDEAFAQSQEGLKLRPDHPDLLHVFALSCEKKGDLGDAEAALRRAVEIKPALRGAQEDLRRIAMSRKLDEEINLLDVDPAETDQTDKTAGIELVADAPVRTESHPAEAAPAPQPPPGTDLSEDGLWGVAAHRSHQTQEIICSACKAPNPHGVGFCFKCGARMG